jgi:hypothetical protein
MHMLLKVPYLERLQRERDKFELLLNRVGFSRRMTMKGVSGSASIKDMLAHILAHEQYMADRLGEILNGDPYTPCKTQSALEAFRAEFGYPDFGSPLLDDTAPEPWIAEKYRAIPLDEIVAHEIQAFSALQACLERLPEDTLQTLDLFDRTSTHTYKLYRLLAADIRRWLRATAVNAGR